MPDYEISVEHFAYTFAIVDKSKVKTIKIVPWTALDDKLFHYLPVFGPVCTILSVSTSKFWRSL